MWLFKKKECDLNRYSDPFWALRIKEGFWKSFSIRDVYDILTNLDSNFDYLLGLYWDQCKEILEQKKQEAYQILTSILEEYGS